MDKIVGIGEYAVSNNEDDLIKTFALSSCIAITAYNSKRNAAGMVHIVLPCPSEFHEDLRNQPYYYAKTAIPLLISKMCSRFGCSKYDLEIKLFGGADSGRKKDLFNIGQRNIKAVKETLEEMGLQYKSADIGGTKSRTLVMEVATGKIKVISRPLKAWIFDD